MIALNCYTIRWLIGEPESVFEERVVALVADVDGNLLHRTRPRKREFPRRLIVAEEDIGHALPFCAGKPGGDERLAFIKHLLDHHRTARKEQEDDGNTSLFHIIDRRDVFCGEREV